MKIKPLDKSFAGAVSRIAFSSKAYWGYPREFMENCREELTYGEDFFENHTVKGAFSRATLTGFYAFTEKSKKVGDLVALFVLPDFIGTGAGGALIKDCLALAKASGIKKIEVESDPFAKPFYGHFGWVEVGQVPSGSIPGRSLPLMELNL